MRRISLLLVALLLVACDGEMGTDAGTGTDAGPMVDAGDVDAGPAMDGGSDAGPPGDDAGGTDAGPPTDAGTDAGPGPMLPVGASGCTMDSDCVSNVCWDYSDYDSACFGTICSVTCVTRMDCVEAARTAGASDISRANCGTDRRCDFVGTGLGSWACAGR